MGKFGKKFGENSGPDIGPDARKPLITTPELTGALGLTIRAVEKQIAVLRTSGQLKRIGPAKGGH